MLVIVNCFDNNTSIIQNVVKTLRSKFRSDLRLNCGGFFEEILQGRSESSIAFLNHDFPHQQIVNDM